MQAEVGVGDDQLHPAQPTGLEAAQEWRPEGTVLTVAHGEAEHFAPAITGHPAGTTTAWATTRRLTRDAGGIHEHIREGLPGQRAVQKALTSASRSARCVRLGLGDAAVRAQGADQVVDLRVLTPCR